MTEPIWQPSRQRVEDGNVTRFMRAVEGQWQQSYPDYASL